MYLQVDCHESWDIVWRKKGCSPCESTVVVAAFGKDGLKVTTKTKERMSSLGRSSPHEAAGRLITVQCTAKLGFLGKCNHASMLTRLSRFRVPKPTLAVQVHRKEQKGRYPHERHATHLPGVRPNGKTRRLRLPLCIPHTYMLGGVPVDKLRAATQQAQSRTDTQ